MTEAYSNMRAYHTTTTAKAKALVNHKHRHPLRLSTMRSQQRVCIHKLTHTQTLSQD